MFTNFGCRLTNLLDNSLIKLLKKATLHLSLLSKVIGLESRKKLSHAASSSHIALQSLLELLLYVSRHNARLASRVAVMRTFLGLRVSMVASSSIWSSLIVSPSAEIKTLSSLVQATLGDLYTEHLREKDSSQLVEGLQMLELGAS